MVFTRNLKQIHKSDTAIAGGKGASLGEMMRASIPVPPGFVILSNTFERFLEETDLNVEIDSILHSVNHKEIHTVENASEKIQALILQAEMPKDIANEIQKLFKQLDAKYVAVRSSATAEDSASAAWAGQLDSFLNTTETTLIENVEKCWASLFTPRAIFYRFEKELHQQKISVAVVVQKMIQSEVSGIAFSVHPITQDRNQLIIEAGFGLGEAIVSGQITPDSYVVEKEPRRVIDKNVSLQTKTLIRANRGGNEWQDIPQEKGEKQTLTDKQILELSEIIFHIENHYGFPCDIEWAFKGGRFYIVQSRPITTLVPHTDKYSESISNQEKLSQLNSSDFTKIYASKGLPFLYEDLICTHYIGWHNIIFCLNGGDYVFAAKTALKRLRKEGIRRITSEVKTVMDTLEVLVSRALGANNEMGKISLLSKYDTERFLTLLGGVLHQYGYFDHCYWDDVYMQSINNNEAREKILLVQNFKNEIRARINKIFFTPTSLFSNLIRKLSNQFGIAKADLYWYLEKELLALFSGVKVKERSLRNRQLCSIFYRHDSHHVEFQEGTCALNIAQHFLRDQSKGSQKISGKSAHEKGVVRGNVRKIMRDYMNDDLTRKSILSMKQGEILISETTDPALSQAIKKAAAIVTDIGGMLSHAAISAREEDIPCIVGTGNASVLLDDGDLIEVDSIRGVVTILEKKEGKES